jgi:hypothetical protein
MGDTQTRPVLVENMAMTALGATERTLDDPQMWPDVRYRAFRSGPVKLVESSLGELFLYDLAEDPGEERNLVAENPELLARMQGELEATRVNLQLPRLGDELASGEGLPELDEATVERLRELGYVE